MYNEPNLFWVKMIDCCNVMDRALALRHKFNKTLESKIADRTNQLHNGHQPPDE